MKPLSQSNSPELAKYTMAITVILTGAPAHKIRSYEKAGLCKPARTASRQRLFSDQDVKVILQIVALEESGANLAGIKLILEMQSRVK